MTAPTPGGHGPLDQHGQQMEPAVVYVVTDLDTPASPTGEPDDPYRALWAALRPLAGLAVVAVPALASTALLFGLVLGWPPLVLAIAAVLALPVLTGLVDLVGARVGWPPLAWTAARIAETTRRKAVLPPPDATPEKSPDQEEHRDG